jgi:tetratricopeptide (TPR) repeat protein
VVKSAIYLFLVIRIVFCGEPQWISEGIELTINNKFDEAVKVFREACTNDPDDYRPYFYLAATLDSKMTHYENDADAENFNAAIDSVIKRVESEMEHASSKKAELVFYLGSAYGYRAYFLGRRGNWYHALANGKKATALLQQSIAMDSTLSDAYLGIGTYKYWLYSKLRFITWLPFIPDDREEGIGMIKKTIAMNARSKYMAMHQLVYILTDYNRANEAVSYADTLLKRYPNSQFMLWAAAHAYQKSNNLNHASSVYKKLSRLLADDPAPNPSHLIRCSYKLADIYVRQSRYEACFEECTRILHVSKTMTIPKKDKDIIGKIYKLRETCKNKIFAARDTIR